MKKIDRMEVYQVLRDYDPRSGVIRMNDSLLALLSGCSERSIRNILKDLEKDGYLRRETQYKKWKGAVVGNRDIVITNPDDKYRGYTVQEHRNLSSKHNHYIKRYPCGTLERWVCPSGDCDMEPLGCYPDSPEFKHEEGRWEVIQQAKVWEDYKHVWEFIYEDIQTHKHVANTGSYKGIKRIGKTLCACRACVKDIDIDIKEYGNEEM